jgi:hypothetical protein
MDVKKLLVISMVWWMAQGAQAAEPASVDSIKELMDISQSKSLVELSVDQIDGNVKTTLDQLMQGQSVNPQMQEIIDDTREKTVALMKRSMRWEDLEPKFIDLYQRTFSEEEVQGMLDFYRTDAGKAVIAKMPTVMQNSNVLMQQHMGTIMPELQQIMLDAAKRIAEAKKQQSAAKS